MSDPISRYFELRDARPDLFVQSEALPLVLDEEKMRQFVKNSGKNLGLVFDNSSHWMVVSDLCEGANGQLFAYSRIIYCNEKSNGGAVLVKHQNRFALLKIFRHGPRTLRCEIVRGFNKPGLTPEQNIVAELSEELGIAPNQCRIQRLGRIAPDSGLCNGEVHVFLAEISDDAKIATNGSEGILGFDWYTEDQFRMAMGDEITDAFTLSAYALYITSKKE